MTRLRIVILILALLSLSGCQSGRVVPNLSPQTPPIALPSPSPTVAQSGSLVTRTLDEQQVQPAIYVFSTYPYLTDAPADSTRQFNAAVEGALLDDLAAFKNAAAANPPDPAGFDHPSTFLSGFQIHTATASLISLELDQSTYSAGAAHPLPATRTVTFSLELARTLTLEDLFTPGSAYLEELSRLAAAQLHDRGTLLFDEGIAPTAENFANWVIGPAGITLIFDVYQVSAYAAGIQRVTIPFEQLATLLVDGAAPVGLSAPAIAVENLTMPIQLPNPEDANA